MLLKYDLYLNMFYENYIVYDIACGHYMMHDTVYENM